MFDGAVATVKGGWPKDEPAPRELCFVRVTFFGIS